MFLLLLVLSHLYWVLVVATVTFVDVVDAMTTLFSRTFVYFGVSCMQILFFKVILIFLLFFLSLWPSLDSLSLIAYLDRSRRPSHVVRGNYAKSFQTVTWNFHGRSATIVVPFETEFSRRRSYFLTPVLCTFLLHQVLDVLCRARDVARTRRSSEAPSERTVDRQGGSAETFVELQVFRSTYRTGVSITIVWDRYCVISRSMQIKYSLFFWIT